MIEKCFADAEELRLGTDAPNLVQEFSARIDSKPDEVQILLHLLHLRRFANLGRLHRGVELPNVLEHIQSARLEHPFASLLLPDLMKNPWIANRAAPDHQPARAG